MKPVAQKPVPASSFDLKTGKVITLLFALIAFGPGLEASEWYASPTATPAVSEFVTSK